MDSIENKMSESQLFLVGDELLYLLNEEGLEQSLQQFMIYVFNFKKSPVYDLMILKYLIQQD